MIDNLTFKNSFLQLIFRWYDGNKRELPFRNTVNPYYIWLSEIILQQTKVAQGLPYYEKFISVYPTIFDLANAKEEEVLKTWQGLGYYSRARNLHFTAKQVVNDYNGNFPTTYHELIKLKGIGDYTASAISSLTSKEVIPVVDGNVYRFISRLFGVFIPINTPKALKEFKVILNALIDENNPDVFNQAIIEFGALYCVPKSPDCSNCIFQDVCYANMKEKVTELPVKLSKKKSVNRYLCFYLIYMEDGFYLTKRVENAIWKNLYEFPYEESDSLFKKEELEKDMAKKLHLKNVIGPFKHVLSHQNIFAKLFVVEPKEFFTAEQDWILVSTLEWEGYPIHRLMEKMIDKSDL